MVKKKRDVKKVKIDFHKIILLLFKQYGKSLNFQMTLKEYLASYM